MGTVIIEKEGGDILQRDLPRSHAGAIRTRYICAEASRTFSGFAWAPPLIGPAGRGPWGRIAYGR